MPVKHSASSDMAVPSTTQLDTALCISSMSHPQPPAVAEIPSRALSPKRWHEYQAVVGEIVGARDNSEGCDDGTDVGCEVVGDTVGCGVVGVTVGVADGPEAVGWRVGEVDGSSGGRSVGWSVGSALGSAVGQTDGDGDGSTVGPGVGSGVGACVGAIVGDTVVEIMAANNSESQVASEPSRNSAMAVLS